MSEKPEVDLGPEFLGCNEGYVFYRDPHLSPRFVKLFDEDGRLLAIIPNVHRLDFAPLVKL